MVDYIAMNSLEEVLVKPNSKLLKEKCSSLYLTTKMLRANFNDFCNWVAGWYPDCKDMLFTINGYNPNTIEELNTSHTIKHKIIYDLSKRSNESMTLGEWHKMILDGISNGSLDPDLEIYFTRAIVDKIESAKCKLSDKNTEYISRNCKINLEIDSSNGVIAIICENE